MPEGQPLCRLCPSPATHTAQDSYSRFEASGLIDTEIGPPRAGCTAHPVTARDRFVDDIPFQS